MADKKISALTPATTPLAGTEVLPIVQSGSTVKVSIANVTAGRSVAASEVTTTGNILAGATSNFANCRVLAENATGQQLGARYTGVATHYLSVEANGDLNFNRDSTEFARFVNSNTDFALKTGNLVLGTAGKGIDFSANTHAPGMTSELLNWYEEGTWTPVISGSSTAGTEAGDKNATYTRIGNRVFARVSLIAYTLSGAAGNLLLTGLPFSARWNGIVAYTEGFTPAFTAAVGAGAALTLSTSTSSATTSVNFRPSVSTSWDNYLTASSVWTGGGGSTYMHIELWGSIV